MADDGRAPNREEREREWVRDELAPVAFSLEELILQDLRRDYPGLPDGLTVHFDFETKRGADQA